MRNALLITLLLFYLPKTVFGQATSGSATVSLTLSEIAMLDIEPNSSPISITLTAPTEAGSPIANKVLTNAKWLNFTSAVTTRSTRNITAQISSGTLPAGTELKIAASTYIGTGAGTLGTISGIQTLSATPKSIVTGIGGAYSGNGANNGYGINYTLSVTNFAVISKQTSSTITITFTLIDN